MQVPNTSYFKPIILKLETFINNSNSKIMYNFCLHEDNILSVGGGEVKPGGENSFIISTFRKNTLKYAKLMVESYTSVII